LLGSRDNWVAIRGTVSAMKTFAICIGVAIVGLSGMSACSEKAGEKADSAIENATQGHKNLGDGPLEKVGEQVDKVTGKKDKDPVDAIHDAVDGDKSTKPN